MNNSSVLIIYTGGTIGMVSDPETGILQPFDFDHLSSQVPELNKFDFNLQTISFKNPVDSSNMSPEIWKKLANIIADNYDKFNGFVILHGTDTMAHTASALSFIFQNLDKSIILTGSQLPIGTIRTDGKENLITAIEIAAATKGGRAIVPEVAIYFEYKLYRGNRASKVNADGFDAFHSDNYPPLAEAGVNIKYNKNSIIRYPESPLIVKTDFDSNIAILKLFPGMTEQVVRSIVNTPGLKGIIMESFGSGNSTTSSWFLNCLEEAISKGIIIVNITQCGRGNVAQGKYETSRSFNKIGVVSGYDLTNEAATAKLMFLLGQQLSLEEIKAAFLSSICGEVTLNASY
jgi:L-asparaginase